MQPGQKVEIQLVDDAGRSVRLANVLPVITLYTGGHRRYVFDLRPTSAEGRTAVDFIELDTQRKEEGLHSLMDYNTPLTACDREVEISVPTESALRDRQRGMEQWNSRLRPAWVLEWPINRCLAPVRPRRVMLQEPVTYANLVVDLPTDADSRTK